MNKGYPLALKENLDAVKQELGTEEQFLESMIKGERFFKKYKFPIIGGVSLLLALGIGYAVMTSVQEKNLEASNKAYASLLKNKDDQSALATLKEKNAPLYQTYLFHQAITTNDVKALESLAASGTTDTLLKNLANYQIGKGDNVLAGGLSSLMEGYELLTAGKVQEAKVKFAAIPLTSPLQNIVKNLEHYQGK